MAAKDSDETAAMFTPKRPRIDSDAVLLQPKTCSQAAKPVEKTPEPSVGSPVASCFNNRLSCSDVGNANRQVHHHYDDGDYDNNEEKNRRVNNANFNNNINKEEDSRQQSMEKEEDEFFSDVCNHTNKADANDDDGGGGGGDDDDGVEELEEGRRGQGAAKTDQNTQQIFLTTTTTTTTTTADEMDNKNLSDSLDPDLNNPDEDDDNLDNVSEISDLAALDEEAWRPVSGPLNWVQRQMSMGRDPRMLFKELISPDTFIPPDLDEMTLWGLLANFITEPPKRKKLNHINTIDDVVDLLKTSKKIMVLTGAGVSVSCGIPDFRSRNGIYARLAVDFPDLPDPQAMFDINYFRNDPRPFFKFAKEIYPGMFKPSKCHKFIKLIEDHNQLLHNYTQNIDTLEQQAGIEKVIQCHGSFATATCMNCSYKMNAEAIREDIFQQVIPKCPKCPDCPSAIMKPDIVFFGENLPEHFHYQMAEDKEQCDLLIVIGSSMKVRPVALIPNYIPAHVPQILINREPLSHMTFDVELLGDGDIIVNDLCKRLGEGWSEAFCDSEPAAVQITKDQLETTSTSVAKPSDKSQSQSFENSILQNNTGTSQELSAIDATKNDAKLTESDSTLTENGQINSSLCKKSAENGSCCEEKITNNSEASHSCERINENNKLEENGENVDNLKSLWKKNKHRKQSLARHLKENQVLFLPPCQYAYPGAEIYSEDEEDEEEDDPLEFSESPNSETSSSWESFSDEDDKKLSSENGIGKSVGKHPNKKVTPSVQSRTVVQCAAEEEKGDAGANGCSDKKAAAAAALSTDLKNTSDASSASCLKPPPSLAATRPDSLMGPTEEKPSTHEAASSGDTTLRLESEKNVDGAKSENLSERVVTSPHEGQANGFIDDSRKKTEGKENATDSSASGSHLHQHSDEMSGGASKTQPSRTENLHNNFASTQTLKKENKDTVTCGDGISSTDDGGGTVSSSSKSSNSSTLSLMEGKH